MSFLRTISQIVKKLPKMNELQPDVLNHHCQNYDVTHICKQHEIVENIRIQWCINCIENPKHELWQFKDDCQCVYEKRTKKICYECQNISKEIDMLITQSEQITSSIMETMNKYGANCLFYDEIFDKMYVLDGISKKIRKLNDILKK